MHILQTDFGILTILVIVITLWFAFIRSNLSSESNWPLIYWTGMVAYSLYSADLIHPYIMFGGTFLALMIRFEFLTQKIIRFLYVLEWFFFGYIIIRGINYVFN